MEVPVEIANKLSDTEWGVILLITLLLLSSAIVFLARYVIVLHRDRLKAAETHQNNAVEMAVASTQALADATEAVNKIKCAVKTLDDHMTQKLTAMERQIDCRICPNNPTRG